MIKGVLTPSHVSRRSGNPAIEELEVSRSRGRGVVSHVVGIVLQVVGIVQKIESPDIGSLLRIFELTHVQQEVVQILPG